MALGFTSRDYWGTVVKQNSLTYIECQDPVDPEDLNSSHNLNSSNNSHFFFREKNPTNHQDVFLLSNVEENTVYFS